jgi:prepilin-type N-terminal cleavage/methylation domain-containing protein
MRGHSFLRGNPTIRRSGGFTLIELIISIVLLGIMAAVGSTMISDTFTTARMVNADNANAGQARYALERLAREIREVKFISTTGYCLDTWIASRLTFKKRNANSTNTDNCDTETSPVDISYSTPPNLTLGGASLTTQVDTFRFDYYLIDGHTTTGSALNVKFIQITLTVKDSISGQSIQQRTRVALRNAI